MERWTRHLTKLALIQKLKNRELLGSSTKTKKSRTVVVTSKTEREARFVLAYGFEKRTELREENTLLKPMLSRGDANKENLCLEARRELLGNSVLTEKLEKRSLELFNDGKKVLLIDEEEKLTESFTWTCSYWFLEVFGKQKEMKGSWMP